MRHGNIDLAKFIMAEETFPIPPYNSREQYLALQRNASSSCSFFFFFCSTIFDLHFCDNKRGSLSLVFKNTRFNYTDSGAIK